MEYFLFYYLKWKYNSHSFSIIWRVWDEKYFSPQWHCNSHCFHKPISVDYFSNTCTEIQICHSNNNIHTHQHILQHAAVTKRISFVTCWTHSANFELQQSSRYCTNYFTHLRKIYGQSTCSCKINGDTCNLVYFTFLQCRCRGRIREHWKSLVLVTRRKGSILGWN